MASPSLPGPSGRPTAGACIIVRDAIGLATCEHVDDIPGRLCIGMLHLPGWPRLLVGSAYLVTGGGMQAENRRILAAWAAAVERVSCHALLGGDLQMPKKQLELVGYPAKLGAMVVSPEPGRATCVTGRSSSQIDLFIVSQGLLRLPHASDVYFGDAVATHRPHSLDFPRSASSVTQLAFEVPARLPTAPPFGPRPKPLDWAAARGGG